MQRLVRLTRLTMICALSFASAFFIPAPTRISKPSADGWILHSLWLQPPMLASVPTRLQMLAGNPFLGSSADSAAPFEVFRARVAVDYGPRLIGGAYIHTYIHTYIIPFHSLHYRPLP